MVFLILFLVMRIMGKRQIGEMQPFEFVITLVISELACIPMADLGAPLAYGIIAVLTLLLMNLIISFVSTKFILAREIICGRPSLVITPDGINEKELKRLAISISDLQKAMRGAGYFSFDEIKYGIFETNGKFSVLQATANEKEKLLLNPHNISTKLQQSMQTENENAEKLNNNGVFSPYTEKEITDSFAKKNMPLTIIEQGSLVKSTCVKINLSHSLITKQLERIGAKSIKDILIATIDENGKMFVQPMKKKAVCLQTGLKLAIQNCAII